MSGDGRLRDLLVLSRSLGRNKKGTAAGPVSEAAAAAVGTADGDSGRAWEREALVRGGDGRRQDGAKGHALRWKDDLERSRRAGAGRTNIREQQRMVAENGRVDANEPRSAGAVTWLAVARWY